MRPFRFNFGWRKPAHARADEAAHAPDQRDAAATELKPSPLAAFDMHQRALQALDQLLESSDEERAAWFAETGALDPALATQVALLLRADAVGSQALPTALPQSLTPIPAKPPERIGPYRLVERLGQGGMGEVFLGVRDDGLFDQKVAIKVIRAGLLSPQLAVRFAEERRILAKLQHAQIAQLFDGGVDASGLSYIVMEYLQGQAITDYVRAERLGLDKILQLFLDVCSAVQFAHQNLVVHADIKPNNIVVTPKAGVKLLDFGIAQLIDPNQDGASSGVHPEPMTRAYAAPERLVGSPASVAGDVYALGALLFELLTGGLPQALTNTEEHTVAISAPGPSNWTLPSREVRERREPGPVRPSELEGDLDAIVSKALSPTAAQRYTSVVELSEDIERFRRRLPVKAHADSWQYRSSKFISRHRLGLAVTTIAMVALGFIAVAMTTLYVESERARALAIQRFGETRSMANYMIFEVDPQLARLPGSLDLRRAMVSKSHDYLKTLEADPKAPPALRLEVARGYLRLARIYGLDINGGIGDIAAARASLRRALSILEALPPGTADQTGVIFVHAEADLAQASESFLSPDAQSLKDGLAFLEAAGRKYEAVLRREPGNIDASLGLWRAQAISGRLLNYMGKPAESVAILERTLKAKRPAPVTMAQKIESNYLRTGSYFLLAEDFEQLKQYDKALSYLTVLNADISELRKQGMTGFENDYMQSSALAGMGSILIHKKQFDQAVVRYQEAIALMRRIMLFGENDALAISFNHESVGLANALSLAGRHAEAIDLISDVVAQTRARVRRKPNDMGALRILALYLNGQAKMEHRSGAVARGCATDVSAWNVWVDVAARTGLVGMDQNPDGPIPQGQARLKACGYIVDAKQMRKIG